MFVAVETYPLVLLNDAVALYKMAREGQKQRSEDGRNLPSVPERAAARAAIFTAFNFLESLLIELTQEHIRTAQVCAHCIDSIHDDLKHARAEISRTYKQWPIMVTGKCVAGDAAFAPFKEIRQLRNELVHPKLDTYDARERTQQELLETCTAGTAKDIVTKLCKMAAVLYTAYGKPTPPEVLNPAL
jgi:hypothetical protein